MKALYLFAWMLTLSLTVSGQPKGESDVRKDLDKTRTKLKMSKARLEEANRKEQQLADELGVTEQSLEQFSERLRIIRTELSLAKNRHEILRQQVLESRAEFGRKQKALGYRLRDMEIEGNASYLQVLLQAKSFTQFITYGEYIQRVIHSERRLIEEVRYQRRIFEQRREAAQRTVNEIRALEEDFREKVTQLDQLQEKQALLLAQLQSERKKLEDYVIGLEHLTVEMEKKLQAMIRERSQALGPVVLGTGRFSYPVRGPLTSPFGYRTHPILGTTRFHSGLDFGVDHGTPIQAAGSGIVLVAEWYGGYGNCVILQHGNDMTTLYAHCSKLHVAQGDRIRQGQIIGDVGSTGMSTGPHLHFEVRQAGTPVDPLGFL